MQCFRKSIATGVGQEAREIGKLYAHVSPNYAAVVESYLKAQEVAKQSK
jgi:hypothetical protein